MLSAILIDDEAHCRQALQKKLQTHCPEMNVVAECSNGEAGMTAIQLHKPDVVFLDIEMPHMNGFKMLEKIPDKNFSIVFTTAYDQYAINAIRCGAFDYLVKPVDVTELKSVVKKLAAKNNIASLNDRVEILIKNMSQPEQKGSKIAISTLQSLEIIEIDSILHLEAVANYTNIYVTDKSKPLLSSKTLKEFEDILPGKGFFRIHNASLINLTCVKKFIKTDNGQVLLTNGTLLEVARRRKAELLDLLETIAHRI